MTRPDAQAAGTFSIGGTHSVHRLGFGAMRLTGKGIWGPPRDRAAAKGVLEKALALGINLIDTADSYGPDVSEELIGEALHPYPEGLLIATKGGLTRSGPDNWDRNAKPAHLKQACEGSLKRLKLDCIELYQLHAPDPEVPYEESVGALADLQSEGKIRHIGVSNVSVAQLEKARSIVSVVTVQNRFNLADRSSEDVLDYCEREQIGFLPWYPLDTGSLTKTRGELGRLAKKRDVKPSQIALAWLLHRSDVILPIPGTSQVTHLEENVQAASIELSDEEMAALS